MLAIEESEKLYAGIVEKQIKNPFNVSFPFMSGFVEHYRSKIDDPPTIEFTHTDEADYKVAKMVTAAWENESTSTLPHAKWPYKDRTAKVNAIFSGRAIYKYWSSREDGYKSNFETADYKDFHCEPDGGGHLGKHLFVGEENIFKIEEDLEDGVKRGLYDAHQVRQLITHNKEGAEQYKELNAELQARQQAMGMDPVTHNYVGQKVYRLVEWYLMYKGVWWYVLLIPMWRTCGYGSSLYEKS